MAARARTLAAMLAGTMALAVSLPAGAQEITTVTVDSAVASGGNVLLNGTLTFGTDATGPILVGEDPQGDATVSGVGVDFGDVSISANPTARRLTYSIEVYDMVPVAGQSAPAYGYTLPISVDGNGAPGYFLASGNAGASFPPAAGPFWQLCTAPAGSYSCPTSLTGTMSTSGITIVLPYSNAAIQPGSLVEPGTAVGCGGGICTTVWAVLLFNNFGGDSGFLSGYRVPGKVTVGMAPAGTPPSEVATTATASVSGSAWTASLPAPAPGSYVVVARTCWGNVDTGQLCAEGSGTVTV